MKLKKHISKILFYSMLLNSISFYSNAASNSNLSRYETLEGEVIDLGDTKSEDIMEIEIFGNTVQDHDNLEDIQSVGELYVNEDGEPILDKQGREQYKIELISNNNNLYDEKYTKQQAPNLNYLDGGFEAPVKVTELGGLNFINPDLLNGKSVQYVLKFNSKTENNTMALKVGFEYTDGTTSLITIGNNNDDFVCSVKSIVGKTIKKVGIIRFGVGNGEGYTKFSNIQISTDDNYIFPKSNKTTILLPCQLMKVGNVADRLYWDDEKGKYIIEKNIKTTTLPEITKINSNIDGNNGCKCQPTYFDDVYKSWKNAFINIPSLETSHISNGDYIIIPGVRSLNNYNNTWLNGNLRTGKILSFSDMSTSISLLFRDSNCTDIEEMNKWVESFSGSIAYYRSDIPQIIETNITKKYN